MQKKKPDSKVPVYSHNPYDNNPFPLLVLDVHRKVCTPANEGFRVLHWHEEIQFVHVLKGSIHIKIYENTLDVPAGDCLFLNRSVLHCITEKENCHYHSILIPERMLGFFPGSIMAQQDVASVLHNPAFTHKFLAKKNPAQEEFFHMLDSFEQLYFDTDAFSHREYRLSLAVTSLWLSFLTLLPALLPAVPVKDYERIRAMLSHIHTHYAKPIAVEDLAACAHIGKSECRTELSPFYRPFPLSLSHSIPASRCSCTLKDHRSIRDRDCPADRICLCQLLYRIFSSKIWNDAPGISKTRRRLR